jgi:Leucine-rich repeat (LRR) protein
MKKILSLILILTLSLKVYSQSFENTTYSVSGEKLVNGNTSMTVSGSAYSTSPITAGTNTLSPGFLTLNTAINNPLVASEIDSLALVDLYNATNPGDTTWNISTGWLTAPLSEWHGIGLNASGRVDYLDLNNNNLTGTLPESLKNLNALQSFFFYGNPSLEGNLFDFLVNYPSLISVVTHDCNFSGTLLPQAFHSNLSEIRSFNNQLTGTIPAEISNATNLVEFNLSNNQLEGEIPTEIGTLTALFDLSLGQNNLSGEIPAELGNLNNLRFLNLSEDSLSGNIPASFGQLANLEELNLSVNNLTGSLPAELGQLTSLRNLHLNNNQISGQVPPTFENLTSLEIFLLYQNQLEGTLPDILHLPTLRDFDVWGNGRLLVEIPSDLGTLTNLSTFAIGGTIANRGEFPIGLYQLSNLIRLDLGGQQFEGTLTEEVANWSQLDNLYLWQNQLGGNLPSALTSIETLRVIDISQNDFTLVPDFSASSLQELSVTANQLSFNSLIPNLSIPTFNFRNQARIGGDEDVELSLAENYEITTEIQAQEGTIFTWIFNNDTIATDQLILTVNNFSIANSGSYRLVASHPDISDFIISSGFSNLKILGGARTWYVDNRPNTSKDFSSLYQAIYASNANDTIYVAGSSTPYQTSGSLLLNSPRVLIGPGYFLEENEDLQFNKEAAIVGDNLILAPGSDGTKIFGLSFSAPVRLNSTFFTEGDTLRNISFIGNRFLDGSNFGFVSHIDGLTFKGNYNPIFAFYITDVQGGSSGLFANYQNFDISHNINILVRPFNFQFSTSAANNGMNNIVFSNNIIDTIANINDAAFVENIIKTHSSNGNVFTNNIDYADNLFQNSSGNLNIDSDFIPNDASLAQGPYAGNNPYQLGGLPPIPSIYDINIGSRLSTKVNVKSNTENNISRIRYLYRRNNQSSSPFNVRGFTPSEDIEVEFLPNRSIIEPNQIYNLAFVAIDEAGRRSHRTYIPYETIAANLSGNVIDVDNINVNEGTVRLFAINPFANKYDTAAVQALNGSNTFNFENLILGDYIILADPELTEYPNLIPTYLGNTIDWQLADTLFLQQNTDGIRIEVEKNPAPFTTPGSEISGFLEEEIDEADSSLRFLRRRRVQGAGVSVRRIIVSSREESSLRLLDNETELIAYIKTDEEGNFTLPNLPSGDYRLRIDYPGVEVDETSDIDFNLNGQQGEVVSVEALVEDGKIRITETGRITANTKDNPLRFKYFPNPVKTELTIKLENNATLHHLFIYDMKGVIYKQIKLQNEQTIIDLKDMKTGSYILRLQDDKGNFFMSKIIKE